jgi:hypothetical protein
VEVVAGAGDNDGGEMKLSRKGWVVGVSLVVVLIGVGWLFFAHNAEPRYEGKPVSYWLKEYCASGEQRTYDPIRQDEARKALLHLGTNAVPYLLQQAFNTNQDSSARTNLIRFIDSLPRSWGMPAAISLEEMRNEAQNTLIGIKPPAGLVLPFLETQFQCTNSTQNYQHRTAIYLLGGIGEGAEQAVPLLAQALKEQDTISQSLAVGALNRIGPKAGAAVPTLRERFVRETRWVRRCAFAGVLCRIDAGQTDALNFLIDDLNGSHQSNERQYAVSELGWIGPNAKAAVPALIKALSSTNVDFDETIIWALRGLEIPVTDYLPKLKSRLESGNPQQRLSAAKIVLFADPADQDARVALAKAAREIKENKANEAAK